MRPALVGLLLVVGCLPPREKATRDGLALELASRGAFDRFAAADLYEEACRRGDGGACWLFERLMYTRRPYATLYKREVRRWKPRCKAGDGRACFRWGLLYDSSDGLGLEALRAAELYRRACERGYAYACQRTAELHVVRAAPGDLGDRDPRAREALLRSRLQLTPAWCSQTS